MARAYGQNFPVTAVVQATRFSAQPEAYDDPGNVFITLLSTDARPEYQVLLRINLSGPGFSLRTRADFLTLPITLRRNIPTVLTGAQLREYFDPANLVFGGQSLAAIQASGGLLPEGPVSLCVEVVDVNRFFDPSVSNTGCANGLVLQHRPPLLLEPVGEVPMAFPQQLRYQWQPQHAGFVARYTLQVFEHTLPGMADNLVVEYTQPIWEQTTNVPFVLMTGAAPLLLPGQRYLVRVRAEDVMGQNAFVNNGWSDVTAFTLVEDTDGNAVPCAEPTGFGGQMTANGTVLLGWNAQPNVLVWELQTPTNGTVTLGGDTPRHTDAGVPPGEYTYVLCAVCADSTRQCVKENVTVTAAPDSVDCLTQMTWERTDSTDTSLTLAWQYAAPAASADGTFVLVWQLADRSQPADSVRLTYTQGSYTIGNLLPGRTYLLSACAECVAGNAVCVDLPPIGGCAAAYTPELAGLLATDALVSWDISGADGVLPVRLRHKPQASPHWRTGATGEVSVFDLDALELLPTQVAELNALNPQQTWMVQLQTQCADSLWSDWSEVLYFCGECRLDDSLRLSGLTDTTAQLLAVAQANATAYQFEYRLAGTDEWVLVPEQPQPLLVLADLLPATAYEVRLRYVCARGPLSNYSPILLLTTLPACGMPTLVAATVLGATDATIDWQPDTHALHTELRYRPDLGMANAFAPNPWQRVETADAEALLAQLRGGAKYAYQLRSGCGENMSAWTGLATFTLDCAPPTAPVCTDITYATADVAWERTSPGLVSWRLSYRMTGADDWTEVSPRTPQAVLDSLDDLAWYEVRVATVCASGQQSVYSDTVQFRTPVRCEQPTGLALAAISPTTAQVNWAVTGTISEWEVLLRDPAQPQAAQQVRNNGPTNRTQPGQPQPGNQQAQQQVGDGTGSNPPPAGATAGSSTPDPYAGWVRTTVTEPAKAWQALRPDTEYRMVVRGRCVENGWTAYSEEFRFRTLDDCRPPSELGVADVYQKTVRAVWEPANHFDGSYKLYVESVAPVSLGPAMQQMVYDRNGNPMGSYANTQGVMGIFRDSMETTEPTALLQRLLPDTDYRYCVKTRCDNYGWTGRSDWHPFHTDECAPVRELVEEAVGRSTMRISWTPDYGQNDYEFRYRLVEEGSDWVTLQLTEPPVELTGLLSNGLYQYELAEVCKGGTGLAQVPQDTFRMVRPSLNNGLYVCGMEPSVDLANQTPLPLLERGDTIMAFDFMVTIKEVSGGNGYFSGQGEINLPYFKKAKFAFVFDNIYVNDDYRMVGGYMQATGFGVEVLPPWADSLLSDVMEVLEVVEVMIQDAQLASLDSMMTCCATYFPPQLQAEIQAVLDCYEQQDMLEQPDYTECDEMLEHLTSHITADIDTVILRLDTMIIEALTLEIIRMALDTLSSEHSPGLSGHNALYASAKQAHTTTFPESVSDGEPPDYYETTVELATGSDDGSPGGVLGNYRTSALNLERKALTLVEEDMYSSASTKLPTAPALKTFALPLRDEDVDVFTPIHTQVNTLWYNLGTVDFDKAPLIAQAKDLLIQKITFLVYN